MAAAPGPVRPYLDYVKVRAAHSAKDTVEVVCFLWGGRWLCPNPNDRARVASMSKWWEDFILIKS